MPQLTAIIVFGILIIGAVNAEVTITLINKCSFTIWPGILGNPLPSPSGFELQAGQSKDVKVADGWKSSRIWARTGCSGSDGADFHCQTGDCGNKVDCSGKGGEPPCSIAEFTLADNNMDTYDVSFVDGSNIPIIVEPVEGTYEKRPGDVKFDCEAAGKCSKDLKDVVVDELKYKVDGNVVGTLSACSATKDPKYCCTGEFDKPETCKSSNFPAKFYSDLKAICPTTYLYAYDDHSSTYTCKPAGGKSSPNYKITFCATG